MVSANQLKKDCIFYASAGGNKFKGSYFENHGATIVPGKLDNALSFDGSDDYVDTLLKPSGDTITISLWFKGDSFDNSDRLVYAQSELNINYNDNKLIFYVDADNSAQAEIDFTPDNNWHHLVGLYDGSTISIYLDNVKGTDASNSGVIDNDGNNLFIGSGAGTEYFDGLIDDVVVYNKVLSDTEISNIYNSGTGKPADEVADDYIWYSPLDTIPTNYQMFGNIQGAVGKIGGAMSFDGVDDYIDTKINDMTNSKTLCAWINNDLSDIYNIFANSETSGYSLYFRTDTDNKLHLLYNDINGDWQVLDGTISITPNENTFVCFRIDKDNNKIRLYVNNNYDEFNNLDFIGTTNNFLLGANKPDSPSYTGIIDDLVVYNRVLSDTEISNIYNNGDGKPVKEVADDFIFYAPLDSLTTINGNPQNSIITNYGTSVVDGKFGEARSFDGTTWINTEQNNLITLDKFSITQHFYSTLEDDNEKWVYYFGDDGAFHNVFGVRIMNTNELRFSYRDGDSGGDSKLISTIDTNTWYDLTTIRNGNNVKIYLNGELKLDITDDETYTKSSQLFLIGKAGHTETEYWYGLIDDFSIYPRVLSDTEISDLQTKPAPEVASDYVFYNDMSSKQNYALQEFGDINIGDGKLSNGWSFDGSDDYLQNNEINNILSGHNTYSIWFKTTDTSSRMGIMDLAYTDSDNRVHIYWSNLDTDDDSISFGGSDGNWGTVFVCKKSDNNWDLNDGNWHHLLITYDVNNTDNSNLYIDGNKQIKNTNDNKDLTSITGEFKIGRFYDGSNNYYFNGILDEIGIYNKILTDEEITTLYNSGHGFNPYDYVRKFSFFNRRLF